MKTSQMNIREFIRDQFKKRLDTSSCLVPVAPPADSTCSCSRALSARRSRTCRVGAEGKAHSASAHPIWRCAPAWRRGWTSFSGAELLCVARFTFFDQLPRTIESRKTANLGSFRPLRCGVERLRCTCALGWISFSASKKAKRMNQRVRRLRKSHGQFQD